MVTVQTALLAVLRILSTAADKLWPPSAHHPVPGDDAAAIFQNILRPCPETGSEAAADSTCNHQRIDPVPLIAASDILHISLHEA